MCLLLLAVFMYLHREGEMLSECVSDQIWCWIMFMYSQLILTVQFVIMQLSSDKSWAPPESQSSGPHTVPAASISRVLPDITNILILLQPPLIHLFPQRNSSVKPELTVDYSGCSITLCLTLPHLLLSSDWLLWQSHDWLHVCIESSTLLVDQPSAHVCDCSMAPVCSSCFSPRLTCSSLVNSDSSFVTVSKSDHEYHYDTSDHSFCLYWLSYMKHA